MVPRRHALPIKTPANENQDSAQSDLQRSRKRRRVHKAVTDPRDDTQFDNHDQHRRCHCCPEIRDEERKRVSDPAQGGHETANEPAGPGTTAPREAAVVGQRLGKPHADAGADGCRQPDHKRIPRVVRRECRGEYRRESGHRTIHQSR
jgi:hypothetical protein